MRSKRIIQHETEIRNDGGDLNRKRKRNANNEEVEEAVSTWFTAVRRKKQVVTGPMLLEKSNKFAKDLGSTTFSPKIEKN